MDIFHWTLLTLVLLSNWIWFCFHTGWTKGALKAIDDHIDECHGGKQ